MNLLITHLHIAIRRFGRHAGSNARSCRCPILSAVRGARSGFTLIELLVVIAIVGLLVSLALPAIAGVRAVGRQCKELAAAKQLMTAFTMYADTNRGVVLPGYPTVAMVNGPMPVYDESGARITGDVAQRYPWRLAPYLDYNFAGLYPQDSLLRDIRANEEQYQREYNISYAYVVSLFPSFGMNVAFVGGCERFNAYDRNFRNRFGKFVVERLDEARRPSDLIAFATARCEQQWLAPQLGKPEGFFRVEPPYFGAAQGRRWDTAYDPAAESPGLNSGFVSLRHPGKRGISAFVDSSARTMGFEQFADMRYWANGATRADWAIGAN
jgi:prepilin-type N-terminal cleavage/methylation domain-containing protein